jgi:manganese/zinc/iron transport system permease protein
MLALAVACGGVAAVGGYWLARWLDGSIAGAMATVAGLLFVAVFLVAPRHGLVARLARLWHLRRVFNRGLLLSHLEGQHGSTDLAALRQRFRWSPRDASRIVGGAVRDGLVDRAADGRLALTARGRAAASEVLAP